MNFLRENIFMVLLTTGTIVLCLVLVLWSNAISDQINSEEISPRKSLSDSIQNLRRPPYSNGNTINAERTRVEGIIESLQKVGNQNIAWNSRNFHVDELTMLDGSKRPAFPFDANVWRENQLASRFAELYHEQLATLQASLKPTNLPTADEIDEEAEHQEKIIQRRERIRLKAEKEATEKTARPQTPAPSRGVIPNMNPGMIPPEADMMPAAPGRTITRRKSGSYSSEANANALDILRVRKAQEGAIYVDDSPFDLVYAKGVLLSKAEPDKLWEAQLGLWVQSDIVAAINDTIQTVHDQQNIPQKQRNVITSPIKRLREITVGKTVSATRRTTSNQNIDPYSNYNLRGMPPPPGQYGPGPEGPYPSRMPPNARDSSRYSTPSAPEEKANNLTQYADNTIFDVVGYSFTVLMPTRYLPQLQECLLKRNYHVILNMQIEAVDNAPSNSKGSSVTTEDLYYYGVEPVCEVTIKGQLLLMAGFTRGIWDKDKNEWLRQPLMPTEVMKTLESSALRPEDKQLIDGRLLQPWNPAAPKAEAPAPTRGQAVPMRGGARQIVMPKYK